MRRHFRRLRPQFEGDFRGFLWHAIEHSGCDRAAVQHFRHCAGGYQFEGDIEAYYQELCKMGRGRLAIPPYSCMQVLWLQKIGYSDVVIICMKICVTGWPFIAY